MALLHSSDTGQVYTETLHRNTRLPTPWTHKTKGSTHPSHLRQPSSPGPTTLFNQAITTLLTHTSLLQPTSFSGVPWSLASQIWSAATRSHLDSAQLWQALVSAYPSAPARELTRRYLKRVPRVQENVALEIYTGPLRSERGQWLAVLTLQNITLPRSELIHSLAGLSNLAVLTVGAGLVCMADAGVDDDVVKAWSRHAIEDLERKPFGTLKVLNLCMQPRVTSRIFKYLRQLPQLAIVSVQGCGIRTPWKEELERAGWRYRPEELASPFSEAGNVWEEHKALNWDFIGHRCLELVEGLEKPTTGGENGEEVPKLHLMLGRDTGMNGNGGGSFEWAQAMMTFVRTSGGDNEVNQTAKGRKRLLIEDSEKAIRKRPTLRASKEQDLCGSLFHFAT